MAVDSDEAPHKNTNNYDEEEEVEEENEAARHAQKQREKEKDRERRHRKRREKEREREREKREKEVDSSGSSKKEREHSAAAAAAAADDDDDDDERLRRCKDKEGSRRKDKDERERRHRRRDANDGDSSKRRKDRENDKDEEDNVGERELKHSARRKDDEKERKHRRKYVKEHDTEDKNSKRAVLSAAAIATSKANPVPSTVVKAPAPVVSPNKNKIGSGGRDIWSIVQEDHGMNAAMDETSSGGRSAVEMNMLFVGSKNCGKTTLINRFMSRSDAPKPTVGLEYQFARRTRGANLIKDITHIWELGGGRFLSKLMEVPISEATIKSMVIVVSIDLSSPKTLWSDLEENVSQIKYRIDRVLGDMAKRGMKTPGRMEGSARRNYGTNHPDIKSLDLCLVPLIIIGTKYDLFQNLDGEQRRLIMRAVRFFAHIHGAWLIFSSSNEDSLIGRCVKLFNHILFGTPAPKGVPPAPNKPLCIPVGSDAIVDIVGGGGEDDNSYVSDRNTLEGWRKTYLSIFPQKGGLTTGAGDSDIVDPVKCPQYKEAAVDEARGRKDDDLERYRKAAARHAREEKERSTVVEDFED